MTYKYFQAKNPEWPRRMKDVIGRKVKLKYDITTRSGKTYKKGYLFVVYGVWRRYLELKDPRGILIGHLRMVLPSDVELLPRG